MERLIDLCPPQLTLVLITRADPPFRLGRMRVRGRVREIRAGDLRFDPSEAAALLGDAADGLDDRRLDDLCERTEGWAAGLVLAGLSLERTDDTARFVDTFRGDDQLVAGYLTDELLAVLDENERRRMIEAAVLHRLSGPLLDAVTGSDDGARWLDGLAARNQLVIRLDAVGEWYRYHHLFRDMLLLEARRSIPDRLPDLHRRAAAWFETSGYPAAAVDHLLAAGDREQAMYLMRIVGPDLLGSGQLRTLRNILERLAAEGELDAICSALSGWDHYLTGRYEEAQHLLDRATATLPADVDPMRTMPLRINLALGTGDVAHRARRRAGGHRRGRVRGTTQRAGDGDRGGVRVGGSAGGGTSRARHRTRADPGRAAGRRRMPWPWSPPPSSSSTAPATRRPARRRSARSTSPRPPDSASTTASRRRSPSGRRRAHPTGRRRPMPSTPSCSPAGRPRCWGWCSC